MDHIVVFIIDRILSWISLFYRHMPTAVDSTENNVHVKLNVEKYSYNLRELERSWEDMAAATANDCH